MFDFRLLGLQKLGPYGVSVLEATPWVGYKAPYHTWKRRSSHECRASFGSIRIRSSGRRLRPKSYMPSQSKGFWHEWNRHDFEREKNACGPWYLASQTLCHTVSRQNPPFLSQQYSTRRHVFRLSASGPVNDHPIPITRCDQKENSLASISGTTQLSPVALPGGDGHVAYAGVNESQSGQSEFRPHRIKQVIQSIRF